jgi:hypothetical protein
VKTFDFVVTTLSALIISLATCVAQTQPQQTPDPNQMLLDATWVPCSDSTEAMYIFQDGRVIYAFGDQGTFFTINGALLNDLRTSIANVESAVETKHLDSCTTLGVILEGPRFILINNSKPTEDTRTLQGRLERLRKYAQRKLDKAMEKLTDQAADALQSEQPQPAVPSGEFRRHLRLSPVAQEWRCKGTIVVAVKVGWTGEVKDAYIQSSRVRGKCASLLAIAAIRAAMLTKFEPAVSEEGKQKSGWMLVEVPFERK